MTTVPDIPQARAWYFRIPLAGWIAHDLLHKGQENIWYFLVMVLSLVGIATMTWGLPALAMAALAMVPVMFVVLLLITVGK